MTTTPTSPSASPALQKARELATIIELSNRCDSSSHLSEELENAGFSPANLADIIVALISERDAALKGYRGMREGLQDKRKELWSFYHECQDWTMQKVAVKPFDDLLTSFPEIK